MAQERIGRYQIIEEIASGTQGAVYEALDLTTNQMVALKVLHATVAGNVEYVERFEREARIMASIDHPNVVKVLDVGREGGRYWLALELLPGSLARILDATQQLPIEGAVRFAIQIADGLSAAHAAGVTHRDIKPQNVLIGVVLPSPSDEPDQLRLRQIRISEAGGRWLSHSFCILHNAGLWPRDGRDAGAGREGLRGSARSLTTPSISPAAPTGALAAAV